MSAKGLDPESFRIGRFAGSAHAWSETARNGAKEMSLISPFTLEDHDLLLAHVERATEENGLSLENVVKATVYLEDIDDRSKYLTLLWREYFPGTPPTSTCLEAGLNGGQIEITVVAAIPD